MTVALLAEHRRDRVFEAVADFVTANGFACGLPDETGRPQVMATVTPVEHCSVCGCDMPAVHAHTRPPVSLDDRVDLLQLSSRVRNALRRDELVTVRDLIGRKGCELLDIRSFGVGCLAEVEAELARHGLALKRSTTLDGERIVQQHLCAIADAIEPSPDALSLISARTERSNP